MDVIHISYHTFSSIPFDFIPKKVLSDAKAKNIYIYILECNIKLPRSSWISNICIGLGDKSSKRIVTLLLEKSFRKSIVTLLLEKSFRKRIVTLLILKKKTVIRSKTIFFFIKMPKVKGVEGLNILKSITSCNFVRAF